MIIGWNTQTIRLISMCVYVMDGLIYKHGPSSIYPVFKQRRWLKYADK